jgi:hypothetical protein
MDEIERKYIEDLKKTEPFPGSHVRVSDTEEYRFYIIGRGEMAFYQQNDRALLFELNAGYGVILKKSIRRWDNGDKVTEAERAVIIDRVSAHLKSRGAEKIIIK